MNAGDEQSGEEKSRLPEETDKTHLLGGMHSPPDPLDELILIEGSGIFGALSIRVFATTELTDHCGECEIAAKSASKGDHASVAQLETNFPMLTLVCHSPHCSKLGHSLEWRFLTVKAAALLEVVRPLAKRVLFSLDCVQFAWRACSGDAIALVRVKSEYEEALRCKVAEIFGIGISGVFLGESTSASEDNMYWRAELVPPFQSAFPIIAIRKSHKGI